MNRVKSLEARVESQKRNEERGARSEEGSRSFAFTRSSLLAPRSSRRGVLMLVVLSMLVLFMLIGTAFLMTSSQSRDAAKGSAKKDQYGNYATRLLDRALLHVMRDTENPHSAIRYHSLLRDLYGTDGFQAVAYRPATLSTQLAGQPARYASAIVDDPATAIREDLGPTQGQFVDIYMRQLAWNLDDPLTADPVREDTGQFALVAPDLRHVVKLERDIYNKFQLHALPLTRGYYNGCLLTFTSGPAAGQSTRVVDYEYLGRIFPPNPTQDVPLPHTRLFRIRVMAFSRTDGQPLVPATGVRAPELTDIAGQTFIVNGRAFNGTGAGYNPLAATGPRLSALQLLAFGTGGDIVGTEIALTPNSAYLDFAAIASRDFAFTRGLTSLDYTYLNNPNTAQVPLLDRPTLWKYQTFVGPGDADESYDAADFQNMFLALQTVTPRSQGRVVQSSATGPLVFDINAPEVINPANGNFVNTDKFLRLDLEDLPWPSFHRPDLVNFWYHRILALLVSDPPQGYGLNPDQAVRAILHPYGQDAIRGNSDDPGGVAIDLRDAIVAIKRKIMLRPIREDHPNFDGSNTQSIPANVNSVSPLAGPPGADPRHQIAVPYWEAVGPWDVDNDNDGVNDSVWVDLGDPVIEAEDGTRYKALYSFLIVDLDSRLNVNAHGLAEHIPVPRSAQATNFDPPNPDPIGLARDGVSVVSADQLPQGLGYGPADISLRPVFPFPWDATGNLVGLANRWEDFDGDGAHNPAVDPPIDSYATLLAGRVKLDREAVFGKYGYIIDQLPAEHVTPGMNYRYVPNTNMPTGEDASPDPLALFKFFDYPWAHHWPNFAPFLSAFGTMPDLKGRYSLGIDHAGQPVYEVAYDVNPNDNMAPFSLLANSPYELNLSDSQRRDTWSQRGLDPAVAFNLSLEQDDDAPFATTDLERVLRAWDAESGTLPSRLWDVVDAFDPLKLMTFDAYRTAGIASGLYGTVSPTDPDDQPKMLAAAQLMSGVYRRLVTTDSFDLPVPGASVPNPDNYAVGADGAPGRANFDDDGDDASNPDEPDELNAPISDDFRSLFGKEAAQASAFDLLRYRVWLEVRPQAMQILNYAEVDLQGLNAADYAAFLAKVSELAEARLNGESFVDANGNGVFDGTESYTDVNANGVYDPPMAPLLAPEVIAGKRMDLNRPFGDGRDNNDNGVVDDPLEAGEPFLDVNGNGRYDNGEPFIDAFPGDADGDGGAYDGPRDQMWADRTAAGALNEPIAFDYTNGRGEPIHPAVAGAMAGTPRGALVRNLESHARQHYARDLYCLMLLLMDDGYIAPIDENDPQIATYLDLKKPNSMAKNILDALKNGPNPPPNPEQRARRILLRKLTCRMIAQWAINCADMRDADVIMTPFEYDEYPWDGWGTLDRNGLLIPLDGDPATNENGDEKMPETAPAGQKKLPTDNMAEVIDWKSTITAGVKSVSTTLVTGPATSLNQTRGVVWGAERPELLITETLAFHDRRTEDMNHPDHVNGFVDDSNSSKYDPDLDQGLRPRGSLFVELYNPNSTDGQLPRELYSRVDSGTQYVPEASKGVVLSRLSNMGVGPNGQLSGAAIDVKRSPAWRLIVVDEWPEARNADASDDQEDLGSGGTRRGDVAPQKLAKNSPYGRVREAVRRPGTNYIWRPTENSPLPPFRPADPDFDLAFNANFVPRQIDPAVEANKNWAQQWADKFYVEYPYIEREFYFTTDNSPTRKVHEKNFNLRIPDRTVRPSASLAADHPDVQPAQKAPNGTKVGTWLQTQRFVPAKLESAADGVKVSPILPGRFGVIGSAGTTYSALPDSYTTTIGRFFDATNRNSPDYTGLQLKRARRIEMRPPDSAEDVHADLQQFLVACNGGNPDLPGAMEIGRSNELLSASQSVYDSDGDALFETQANIYKPCVAIPIEGMSVSEPAWGWEAVEIWAAEQELARRQDINFTPYHPFNPKLADGEGRYAATKTDAMPHYYDVPFDSNRPELYRTGTTANYRSIHLQRLANPLLPWNPPRGQDGHIETLPVNPYRTVDTSSVDLTAFNGVTGKEGSYQVRPDDKYRFGQLRPWGFQGNPNNTDRMEYRTRMAQPDTPGFAKQVWHFKSLERGSWARLNPAGTAQPPLRSIWAQEPPRMDLRQLADAIPADDPDKPEGKPSDKIFDGRLWTTMAADATGVPQNNYVPQAVKDPKPKGQGIVDHQVNMVLEHSLGFANESFGKLYTQNDAPVMTVAGAPRPYTFKDAGNNDVEVTSTYPWLSWNNRPLVSTNEILQVPAASSSQMLRLHSTINPNLPSDEQPNPYDGDGWINPPPPGPKDITHLEDKSANPRLSRRGHWLAPFGYLLNPFLSAGEPAQVAQDDNGDPIVDPADPPLDPTVPTPPDSLRPLKFVGAPHFYRILEYVHVPSRYVGTETLLNPDVFNDNPNVTNAASPLDDLSGKNDPRYNFQPPFNQVSRERDPGRVNLNTVTGRRAVDAAGIPRIWSEVFDGIMHRYRDEDLWDTSGNILQLGHFGPAWRDVVLSRRGYIDPLTPVPLATFPSPASPPLQTSDRSPDNVYPDVAGALLQPEFPSIFSNPFRAPDSGDLVPLANMVQKGVQAGLLRSHPYRPDNPEMPTPGAGWGRDFDDPNTPIDERDDPLYFVDTDSDGINDSLLANGLIDDAREAGVRPQGFDNDELAIGGPSPVPLFSEAARNPFIDSDRNPYMKYQPMTRLGNLVSTRSNVYAVWITVGYFEVEKAPDWNDPDPDVRASVRARFGNQIALYNRVYPDGFMLGREVGSETGDNKRARGFYIVDRTEEVGFKPGDDLNVERAIRLRRRIE